jgi:hypothetical protein
MHQSPSPPDIPTLRLLAERWRTTPTLEYRSRAVLNHAGEFRVEARVWVRLRRPQFARLVFLTDNAEVSRLRVCDGRIVWERGESTPLRPARTLRSPYKGDILANIAHPLDETAYCANQFFSHAPFLPPPIWANGAKPKISEMPEREKGRDIVRIVFEAGVFRDTLIVDRVSLAPLSLVRVGEHAGAVQEILRETFETVKMGHSLPPDLFLWSEADQQGRGLRV